MGSAAAITFALAGTLIVFVVLRSEHPRLESELGSLAASAGLFALLTAAAGSSFYGMIKDRGWRRFALAALVVMLAIVAAYHAWPP